MSKFVAVCFLSYVSLKSLSEIAIGLIGNAGEDPEYISEFVCQVILGEIVRGLRALIAIGSSDNACHFTHFLSQLGYIGERRKVPYTVVVDPPVDYGLDFT